MKNRKNVGRRDLAAVPADRITMAITTKQVKATEGQKSAARTLYRGLISH